MARRGEFLNGTFTGVPNWLIDAKIEGRIGSRELELWIHLQRVAAKDGFTWLSHGSLAKSLDCSISQVRTSIERLERVGAITGRVPWELEDDGQTTNVTILYPARPSDFCQNEIGQRRGGRAISWRDSGLATTDDREHCCTFDPTALDHFAAAR